MTPETIAALLNMGSAGAVIAVVILFLKSNEKRDAEWRNFFTSLNRNNADDIAGIVARLDKAVTTMADHDQRAKAIYEMMQELKAMLQAKKQPARKAAD